MRAALLITAVLFSAPALAGQPTVRVQKSAAVTDPVVRLGDIATLEGFSSGDEKTYARIELGRAPAVGLGQFMPRAYLEARIREGGMPAAVRLRIPRRVEIKRKALTMPGEELRQMVRAAIQRRMPHDPEDVAAIDVPSLADLRVPDGAKLKVVFADGEAYRGPVVAELVVRDGGEVMRTRRISARVDVFQTVFGVAEPMRRGRRMTTADLVELRVPHTTLARDVVLEPRMIEGAMLRRAVKPGEPLRDAWLQVPPVIERGDRVRMVAVRGPLRITARGEALGDGARGAYIRVRNLDSRKIVSGRVTGPGEIEMEF